MNFVPKFDLNYLNNKNAAWLMRSHKRSQKNLGSALNKHDHMRFIKRIDRVFNIDDTAGNK